MPAEMRIDFSGFIVHSHLSLTHHTLTPSHPHTPSLISHTARYSLSCSLTLLSIHSVKKLASTLLREDGIRLPEGIVVQTRNFRSMKLHVHPRNKYDADGLKDLLEKRVLVETVSHSVLVHRTM